jgi:hypothetical protein
LYKDEVRVRQYIYFSRINSGWIVDVPTAAEEQRDDREREKHR